MRKEISLPLNINRISGIMGSALTSNPVVCGIGSNHRL